MTFHTWEHLIVTCELFLLSFSTHTSDAHCFWCCRHSKHHSGSSRGASRGLNPQPRRHGESSPGRSERRVPNSSKEGRRTPSKADQKPLMPPASSILGAELRKAALEAMQREQARQAAAPGLKGSPQELELNEVALRFNLPDKG